MSVDSPPRGGGGARGGSRAGHALLASRNEPLFTSRHRVAADPYTEPNFITDSLNTSFASPSPARPTVREGKARGSLGRGRRLPPPARRIQQQNENPLAADAPGLDSSPERGPTKRALLRTSTSDKPLPMSRTVASRSPTAFDRRNGTGVRARTPSPRGIYGDPIVSPVSNASESSPPRGLAESYRRIQDEEFLAGQQDSGSEEEMMLDEAALRELVNSRGTDEQVLRDIVNGEVPRHLLSPTPSSRRSSRRFSPRPGAEGAEKGSSPVLQSVEKDSSPVHQNATRKTSSPLRQQAGHGSGGSSPFDEVTLEEQEASRALSRHEWDQQRLSAALAFDRPFRKARRGTRLGAALETLPRSDPGSYSGSGSMDSHNSSRASDPSLNIPSGWGRKARVSKSWLDRIREDRALLKEQNLEPVKTAPVEPEKAESIAEWVENASGDAMDTIDSDSFRPDETEDLARPMDVPSPIATEKHAQAQPKTTEPQNSRIDAIRERERQSQERDIPKTHQAKEAEAEKVVETVRRVPSGLQKDLPQLEEQQKASGKALGAETVAPAPKEPRTKPEAGTKKPATGTITQSSTSGSRTSSSSISNQKADHSRNLLRSLARATSASPSPEPPTRPAPEPSEKGEDADAKPWFGGRVASLFTKVHPVQESKAEGSALDSPAKKLALDSKPTQSALESLESEASQPKMASTPQVAKPRLEAKTPLVTGAWVDTPATKATTKATVIPTIEEPISTEEPSTATVAKLSSEIAPTQTLAELESTAPKLKTALADIIAKAKADRARRADGDENDETFQLDDSTIESLEDLLASSDNSGAVPSSSIASVETPEATGTLLPVGLAKKAVSATAKQKTETAALGKTEDEAPAHAYSRLASRLTHLKTSITDAKEGVGSLQKRLARSKSTDRRRAPAPIVECDEAGELHDFIVPCAKCHGFGSVAAPGDDTLLEWQTVRLPLPRLWTFQPGALLPTPSWTGWMTMLLCVFLTTELLLSQSYSPPFYATHMTDYGVDIRAPRPPFVSLKLLWQQLLRPLLQPLFQVLFIAIRVFCALAGIDAGPFGPGDEGWVARTFERTDVLDAGDYWARWRPSAEVLKRLEEPVQAAAAAGAAGAAGWFPGGGWFAGPGRRRERVDEQRRWENGEVVDETMEGDEVL